MNSDYLHVLTETELFYKPLDPRVWGTGKWVAEHLNSFTYPKNPTLEEKLKMKKYLDCYDISLPCGSCSVNWKKHISKYDLNKVVQSKTSLIKFWVDIHNDVNKSLNKKTYTYNQVMAMYMRNVKTIKLY